MITREQFFDLLRRTTDEGWLNPLLEDPSSLAVLNSLADTFARVSLAGDNACNAVSISGSPGGNPGVATIRLSRAAAGTAGTIPRGYGFVDSRGVLAISQTAIPVGAGALAVDVVVETLRFTERVNTVLNSDFVINSENIIIQDVTATSTLIAPPGDPSIVATTFTDVENLTPIVSSTTDFLSAHGRERGQLRQPSELTENYRLRVRNIPDAISPRAIIDAILGVAQQAGIPTPTLYEPFDFAPDVPIDDASFATPIVITTAVPHSFTTEQLVKISGVQGNTSANGLWQIVVLTDTTFELEGSIGIAPYIVSAADVATLAIEHLDHLNPAFWDADFGDDLILLSNREVCAYLQIRPDGVPRDPDGLRAFYDSFFWDDPVYGYLDVTEHPVLIAGLMAIWEEVNRKRAAGVNFDVVLLGATTHIGIGATLSAILVPVFTLTPTPGKVWLYSDGFLGHILYPSGHGHALRVTYEDASVVTTPTFTGMSSERISLEDLNALGPVLRITQIEGLAQSNGIDPVILVGEIKVLEVTI